ncbi:MAG: indole-3-glycerol phosphate synthase TrpC [Oscillospiraceae bacterium]|jgi:indole-3-glycerol phosphate synthase|nr:indole-3-glycerol phosphate synthase TrpC [Oscillospiraceae bacterium]
MILDDIANRTAQRLEAQKRALPQAELRRAAEAMPPAPSFRQALKAPGLSIISEVKRASPSKGMIAEAFPYLEIARTYEQAGAAAISVLTEPEFFLGSNQYLEEIARQVRIPCLRKDFTIDPYQIYQAKALGAASVLLICALLRRDALSDFIALASQLGMASLVEAHDESELTMALEAGAQIVGVNNRDLRTFRVDFGTCLRLRPLVPPEIVFVAESGIAAPEDARRLQEAGVDAALIGETLMRASDKAAMIRLLRGDL